MFKLLASFRKELLILFRDIPGLVILFILPLLLILVVTMAQNYALTNQLSVTKVLIVNLSGSPHAGFIIQNLKDSRLFEPVTTLDNKPIDPEEARKQISSGAFRFGMVFYPGDTAVHLIEDPALHETFRANQSNAIMYLVRSAQSRLAVEQMLAGVPPDLKPAIQGMITQSMNNLPPLREITAMKERSSIKPNVIQNNVPGFILFAMFFVVLPLSGSVINEKKDVAFQRLITLPVHMATLLSSKVIVYSLVCIIQFLLMLAVGRWIFPIIMDVPGLETGTAWGAIAFVAISASLAAVGFGILVGAAATSHNQAALFGAVMVVLLGVVSGTFLPVHVMPEILQTISSFSPLRWGIDSFIDLFIRQGTLLTVLQNSILLILFFGLAMTISLLIFAKRK